MIGLQENSRWFIKLHKRLIKPTEPVYIHCPACGRNLFQVNSDMIEITNDFGIQKTELKAVDSWMRLKHTCKAMIVVYWA